MKKIPKTSAKRNVVQVPVDAQRYKRITECAAFFNETVDEWITSALDAVIRGDTDDMESAEKLRQRQCVVAFRP